MVVPSWAPKRKKNESKGDYQREYYTAQRLDAQDRANKNPGDIDARKTLQSIEYKKNKTIAKKQGGRSFGDDAHDFLKPGGGLDKVTNAGVNLATGIEGGRALGAVGGAVKGIAGKLAGRGAKAAVSAAPKAVGSAKMLTGEVPARGNPNTAKVNRTKAYGPPKTLSGAARTGASGAAKTAATPSTVDAPTVKNRRTYRVKDASAGRSANKTGGLSSTSLRVTRAPKTDPKPAPKPAPAAKTSRSKAAPAKRAAPSRKKAS